ncbi:conserved hypothetical protein [Paecilomyces variotii No. 5]|uniref:Phosphatidylethanolamine-binding protein n=1 Tax=Byssochlamys spectabilis (strain No. 5 / NBRC 109023) TaxID=1356009 RepID=V5GDS5_BYSSN|nr:conserved hypothetical protein [Paecilomyces variotii No. 5]
MRFFYCGGEAIAKLGLTVAAGVPSDSLCNNGKRGLPASRDVDNASPLSGRWQPAFLDRKGFPVRGPKNVCTYIVPEQYYLGTILSTFFVHSEVIHSDILVNRPVPMSKIIERSLAWLLYNRRSHDSGLLHKSAPFALHPTPTMELECAIGPSGSTIPFEYSSFGDGHFPTISWIPLPDAVEYLLILEDPDAPLAEPVVHGIYYGIPANKSSLSDDDFSPVDAPGTYNLSGGFKYGINRRKVVYMPPRGFLGHGPHRFFLQIVALKEALDQNKLSIPVSKEDITRELRGKVMSWGCWIGIWERTE